MNKIISTFLIPLLIISIFVGCSNKKHLNISDTSPYNFVSYEKLDDVSSVEQISLDNKLSQKCVSYKFTYLSDYNEVKAYISIPLDCIETKTPYKCIIYNRGGNNRIGFLEDEDTAKLCSATNRIVVASQYRGADGGTGTDQFGGEDLNDVIKLIDLCDSVFEFADISDLCVAGISRGGMMSYMTARQDKRVKGIIAISAVSDLFQAYEERDYMKTLLNNYIGGSPDDLPYEYEKRSAIYWTDEINVPILIIHSKSDKQVSFSQTEKLYSKLKSNNADCKLITYEDDIHGFHKEDGSEIHKWLKVKFG